MAYLTRGSLPYLSVNVVDQTGELTLPDPGLQGKTAIVTGGASGIGLGIAEALAAEGVGLAIVSRNPDPVAVGRCGVWACRSLP